jgi:hypothetical protein
MTSIKQSAPLRIQNSLQVRLRCLLIKASIFSIAFSFARMKGEIEHNPRAVGKRKGIRAIFPFTAATQHAN